MSIGTSRVTLWRCRFSRLKKMIQRPPAARTINPKLDGAGKVSPPMSTQTTSGARSEAASGSAKPVEADLCFPARLGYAARPVTVRPRKQPLPFRLPVASACPVPDALMLLVRVVMS
jgi:hypothetical protein